jgi:hypothetical protein
MQASVTDNTGRDDSVARIPSCALDEVGKREQLGRYRQLACAVTGLDRTAERLIVEFDQHLDRQLLERTLQVERECCPFFVFRFREIEQRLEITVREPQQLEALEALAIAFADTHAAATPLRPFPWDLKRRLVQR